VAFFIAAALTYWVTDILEVCYRYIAPCPPVGHQQSCVVWCVSVQISRHSLPHYERRLRTASADSSHGTFNLLAEKQQVLWRQYSLPVCLVQILLCLSIKQGSKWGGTCMALSLPFPSLPFLSHGGHSVLSPSCYTPVHERNARY